MKSQTNKISPKPLLFLHNITLSIFSFFLLACLLEELVPLYQKHGLFWLICNKGAFTGRLQLLYYLNYLTKYYELIDTVFLVLAKKKLEFLHVYHHSLTMALCFVELAGQASVQWVPIVLNLAVHVVMYYYYAISLFYKNIWWKKYLTTMQITQFVIDCFAIYFASYVVFSDLYFPSFKVVSASCSGAPYAAYFGCSLITSYLILFVQFYGKTYQQRKAKAVSAAPSPALSPSPSPKKRVTRSRSRAAVTPAKSRAKKD